ncbi:matrix metalloproteinase-19-like [Asterias amurensis]|uniref:matrix metalloproteinase-19-like n=1 Tax=Asterias amurensis TaxID=7602 RepID=UPI003AB41537
MTGKTLLLSALLIGVVAVVHSAPVVVDSDAAAMMYLNLYGYMVRQPSSDGSVNTEADLHKAICDFQDMANLTVTCELDAATMAKMNMPRCGMPDNMGHSLDAKRKKRYSLGSRWSRLDLTYRIDSRTPDIANPDDVDDTMAAAFKVWSDVTPLTFTRVFGTTAADIIITFNSGNHNDGNPFDGASGVLAHAYFPENGDAHFDEAETWTINTFQGINLFQVAAHEFGHSLGLGHSNIEAALMAPFYRGYVPDFELHSDDVAGIQAHYGVNSGIPDATMPPNPVTPSAGGCSGNVDAVATTQDRSTYIFEGSDVWKVEQGANAIADGFPKSIASTFAGLPSDLDAALYYPRNQRTYFFKGSQYWRFNNEAADAGYPRDIGDNWVGLPDDLDAAFVWSGNGRIYFIKGDEYYRFSSRVDTGYPRPLSVWNIPGNQVSAATQWINSRTYFLTSSGDYYRFNDRNFDVDAGYPRDVATNWQGCTNTLQATPSTNDNDDNGVTCIAPSVVAVMTSLFFIFVSKY